MALEFVESRHLTLGVEQELQLLDPMSHDLSPSISRVLARVEPDDDRITAEIFQSMVEVRTGVCSSVADVRTELGRGLSALRRAADDVGVELAMAGSHPFARYRDRIVYPSDRYHYLLDRNQWIARRLMIFGLHVHVGMRSGDAAITAMNGLLPQLPYLLALSASSPFYEGDDTGLASARSTIFEAAPTAGTPPTFGSWSEFQVFIDAMQTSSSISCLKDLWWDVRPCPRFGTVEVRICDAIPTLDETLALVAVVQCLAARIDDEAAAGRRSTTVPIWIIRENKWRVSRWGIDAELVVDANGRTEPIRDGITRMLEGLLPHAKRLDCESELGRVAQMLDRGCSYERQRRVHARTRSLRSVVQALVQELQTNRPVD